MGNALFICKTPINQGYNNNLKEIRNTKGKGIFQGTWHGEKDSGI